MRINKYLSRSGISSRRNAEKLILEGRIKANGNVIKNLSYQVDIENDIIKFDNEVVNIIDKKYYIMLNKPINYTCSNSRQFGEKLIYDLINIDAKLFSIGRLDKDSRGLILITNDGDIYNNIIHPSNTIYKEYIVELDKVLTQIHKKNLEQGVDIGGYITSKSKIKILSNKKVSIKICEGKNRQIRRMFSALGYTVLDLNRISIGNIYMDNLEIGTYRNLTKEELNYLRNI